MSPASPECRAHRLIADVTLVAGGEVLLVRYRDVRRYDGQHGWFLPDDALQALEHPDEGARRILRDQVGIDVPVTLDHIESFGNGVWHLVFHYRAEAAEQVPVRAGENVADARWFDRASLPASNEMAHEGWGLDVLDRILAAPRKGS